MCHIESDPTDIPQIFITEQSGIKGQIYRLMMAHCKNLPSYIPDIGTGQFKDRSSRPSRIPEICVSYYIGRKFTASNIADFPRPFFE